MNEEVNDDDVWHLYRALAMAAFIIKRENPYHHQSKQMIKDSASEYANLMCEDIQNEPVNHR
jgi:hypothetical protein